MRAIWIPAILLLEVRVMMPNFKRAEALFLRVAVAILDCFGFQIEDLLEGDVTGHGCGDSAVADVVEDGGF
jgi:hypothetical protein